MWNLSKGNQFLPNTTLKQIKSLYKQEKRAKPKLRLLAAIHRKKGKSLDEIAYLVTTSRNTIHGWLRNFSVRGIQAKDSIKQSGRPIELTLQQRKNLVKDLEQGPPHNPSGLWTSKTVREHIEKKYGHRYVKQHVWRLLVSLGFSIQRPRKQHYLRPSKHEILQFKKKLDEKQSTTVRKDLLWARKMRQPSASFQLQHADGLDEGAIHL